MMATTMIPLQSITLAADTSTVTFSSIPQTYTDLVLRMTARNTVEQYQTNVYVSFNAVTSGYSHTYMYGNNSLAGSSLWQSASAWSLGAVSNGYGMTANMFAVSEVYFPSYMWSNVKVAGVSASAEDNTTGWAQIRAAAYYNSSTAAITSLKLVPESGSFVTGSTFHLYGIKNS